ncbi:hypothetical protein PQR02_24245, partial [Paraburkholderia sediminicola]
MATKGKQSISEHAKNYWDCEDKERIALLLFVQRARELVLHTSSLMVKRQSASSFSIAQQILALLRQHKRAPHSSTETNVAFLLKEFDDSIKTDEVTRALVGDRLAFLHGVFSESGDTNKKLEAIEFVLSRLAQREHFALCADGIKRIVATNRKEKDRLMALTESFMVSETPGTPRRPSTTCSTSHFSTKRRLSRRQARCLNSFLRILTWPNIRITSGLVYR